MLYPDWLWKGCTSLLCFLTLLCADLEGRSFDHCETEDGRPGICVVKIYCRESSSQPLLKCEGDDSYCCPIPTTRSAAVNPESPKRPPNDRTRSESEPKRPLNDRTRSESQPKRPPSDRHRSESEPKRPTNDRTRSEYKPKRPPEDEPLFHEDRFRPSGPRKGSELDDSESRYAPARPVDVDKSRRPSDGQSGEHYPVPSGPGRPDRSHEPRETYDSRNPEQNRPRGTYDSDDRKHLGNARPSFLDPGRYDETKRPRETYDYGDPSGPMRPAQDNPRDTYDFDDRELLGNSRPSFLDPEGYEETKRPRDTYDSKQTGTSRRGSPDSLRPAESNRNAHDSDNRRPKAPTRPRPEESGHTGRTRTQKRDPPGDKAPRREPEIRFPGDRMPLPPRQRDDDIPAGEVQRNDPKLSDGRATKDRHRPTERDHDRRVGTSPGRPREYDESSQLPPDRDGHSAEKESNSRTPARLPDLHPAPKPQVPACGVRPYDLFIAGGGVSDAHEWPWMAAIFRRFQDSRPKAFLCGGSLINTRFVLTAAHCFVNNYVILPASSFVVRLGSNYLSSGEEYTVGQLILHQNHSGSDFFNDIALIRLAGQVAVSDKIAPICLPPPDMQRADLVGRTATVAGWGDVAYRTSGTRVLQHVTIPVVSNQECSSAYSRVRGAAFLARGTDHVICAGLKEGGKDACLGDSGGPLMLKHNSDQWVVIGIVSLGYKCAEPGYYGVYTRVTHYMSWIGGHIRQRH